MRRGRCACSQDRTTTNETVVVKFCSAAEASLTQPPSGKPGFPLVHHSFCHPSVHSELRVAHVLVLQDTGCDLGRLSFSKKLDLIDIMRQIVLAVSRCISNASCIAISSPRTCVSNDCVVILIDFEAGLRLSSQNALVSWQRVGTEGFPAPEIDQQQEYGFPADLYSLGQTLSWLRHSRMQAPPRSEHVVVWRSVDALITSMMLNPLSGKRLTIEVVNETLMAASQNLRSGVPGESRTSAFPLATKARAPTGSL